MAKTNGEASSLGAFSVSLTVQDLARSRAFYEALGFELFAGSAELNYLIMANGGTKIGLFQGMFEKNILTFNPGWDQNAKSQDSFQSVQEIQSKLQSHKIALSKEIDPASRGPGSIMLEDPDGNTILIDQHCEAPKASNT